MNTKMTKKEFDKLLADKLFSEFATDLASATDEQIYRALALIVRGMLSAKRKSFMSRTYGANGKQVYYLCMEFLMGRSLKTSLFNMGLAGVAEAVLKDHGIRLDNIYEQEPDAGLGNGGLGRLAACYLDGMATRRHSRHGLFHPVRIRHLQAENRGRLAGPSTPTTGCPAAVCG